MNTTLPPEQAYRLWAESYEQDENPLTSLDSQAITELGPFRRECRLLDLGCGTGRRLPSTAALADLVSVGFTIESSSHRAVSRTQIPAAELETKNSKLKTAGRPTNSPSSSTGPGRTPLVVGLDLVPAMLARGQHRLSQHRHLVAGDLRLPPLRAGSFDLIWCRLVIGHVEDLTAAYREIATLVMPGGRVVITDLHPELAATGAARTFRSQDGARHSVQHFIHRIEDHELAAKRSGLVEYGRCELTVQPEHQEMYRRQGRLDLWSEHQQQPVLLGLGWERTLDPNRV